MFRALHRSFNKMESLRGKGIGLQKKILMPMALTDWQCILMTLFYRNNVGEGFTK